MEVHVYTTQPEKDSKAFKAPASFIKIIRVGNLKKKGGVIQVLELLGLLCHGVC